MPKKKKRGRKKRAVISHAAYGKMMSRYRRSKRGEELSKSRGHIPVKVLESHLAKMPRHMNELARLIKQRRASGE